MTKERTQKQIDATTKLTEKMKAESPEAKKARLDKGRETREKNKALKALKADTEKAMKGSDYNIAKVQLSLEKEKKVSDLDEGSVDEPVTSESEAEVEAEVEVEPEPEPEEEKEIDETMAPVSTWAEPVVKPVASADSKVAPMEKVVKKSKKQGKAKKIIYYSESETDSDTEIIYKRKPKKKAEKAEKPVVYPVGGLKVPSDMSMEEKENVYAEIEKHYNKYEAKESPNWEDQPPPNLPPPLHVTYAKNPNVKTNRFCNTK
jgi:hypothetical protein